jgi:putative methionine-R-sulfoxide reductase with GAF domain
MQDLPQDSIDSLHRVTQLLSTQRTLPAKLETVVALVERTLPNCNAAGVTLLIDGKPTTAAVSGRLAVEIDLVQYGTGEGPCLAAISDGNVIRIDFLERDSRFTRFAPGALDHKINSVLSIPLITTHRVVGALNMYSHLLNAFDPSTEEAVQPMAEVAADAIGTSPLYAYALDMVEGLMETLESQALMQQAVGVIMAGEGRTAEEALDRLRQLALASGKPMRAVAQFVLEEHPTTPPAVSDTQLSNRDDGKDPS